MDDDQKYNQIKKTQTQYSQSYKDGILALAERIGFASKAAAQLGIQESQLYYWKNKLRQQQTTSERFQQLLADENVRLKRLLAEQAEELAIVKKAAAYFANSLTQQGLRAKAAKKFKATTYSEHNLN